MIYHYSGPDKGASAIPRKLANCCNNWRPTPSAFVPRSPLGQPGSCPSASRPGSAFSYRVLSAAPGIDTQDALDGAEIEVCFASIGQPVDVRVADLVVIRRLRLAQARPA